MPPSRPLPSAATAPAHPPRRGTDAAKLGLKPPRDPRSQPAKPKPRSAMPDAASARHVPSSPLARNVMSFRSTSSGDSNGASKSPLRRIANNKIRKSAVPAKPERGHVHFGGTVHIGAPRPSKAQRPRAKYQGSPTLSTPPSSASKSVSRTGPAGANPRPMYKRKVLEKPKAQPIFKKALANTLTSMIAKCKTQENKAAIRQVPAPTVAVPTLPKPVTRTQVLPPAPKIPTAPALPVANPNMSHPPPALGPQAKPPVLAPPVPTPATFRKHAFVATWITSQVSFASARADRLTRGIPPPNASGAGYLIHSPLPFAPPMDHLPEIESDVWSAGDLMDMRMEVRPVVDGVPSDQENWRPADSVGCGIGKEPMVHAFTRQKEPVVHSIAKEVAQMVQVQEVDMDEAATILNDGVAGDGRDDDASSQSSERTVVPQGGEDLCSLPGLVSSEKHFSPPKTLARQDSAVMFAPMDVDSPKPHQESPYAFPILDCQEESPSPLFWAVVPCSDLSMNGLGDEFLEV